MDEIEFRNVKVEGRMDHLVDIFINGQNLIDLVREQELPFDEAEGHPNIAGGSAGLSIHNFEDIYNLFLSLPNEIHPSQEQIPVFGCKSCGELICWPLMVRIVVDDALIRWSDFNQPYRTGKRNVKPWLYHGFGPFQFDRTQYEGALMKLKENDE